jgi:hypothetical protein
MSALSRLNRLARLSRSGTPGPRPEIETRPLCFLKPLHSERALGRALAQHLAGELPDVAFTLEESLDADALWVCGYEAGHATLIRRLRARHPAATLLVTSKEPIEAWADEAFSAGADHALRWPTDLVHLGRLLNPPYRRRA